MRRAFVISLLVLSATSSARALTWPDVAESAAQALASSDPALRRSTVRELGRLSRERALPLLDKALRDDDLDVRLAAAEVAAQLKYVGAVDAIVPWLGEHDTRLRIAAADLLRAMPSDRTLPLLARALGDNEVAVRSAAAMALGAHASAEAVSPLIGRLDDSSPNVRRDVVRALGRIRNGKAVVPLIGKVQDSVPEVRQEVAFALGELGDPRAALSLILVLRDANNDVRVAALQALGKLHPETAVDSIAQVIAERNPSVRRAALLALGRIGTPNAIRALIGALGGFEDAGGHANSSPVREALVEAGKGSIEPLKRILGGSPSEDVAASAAWTLGELRAPQTEGLMASALRRGILPKIAGLRALAKLNRDAALPSVLELLEDTAPDVRAEALSATDRLLDPTTPDGRAVEPLGLLLKRPALLPEERRQAIHLLGRTGAVRAVGVLLPFLSSKDDALLLDAVDALARINASGTDTDVATRDALAKTEARLLELLRSSSAPLRLHAALALGSIGSDRSLTAILSAIRDESELDRTAAYESLGGLVSRSSDASQFSILGSLFARAGGMERDALIAAAGRAAGNAKPARELLEQWSKSDDELDRRGAAASLGASPDGLARLRDLVRDRSPNVRAEATWAMGNFGAPSDIETLREIAGKDDFPSAVNAVASWGRILFRNKSTKADGLCAHLAHPHPHVRVNVLTALRLRGERCGDGAKERSILADDRIEAVREAAARLLFSMPMPADADTLSQCREHDVSSSVGEACSRNFKTAEGISPLLVYIVPSRSTKPEALTAFAIANAHGWVHSGISDRRGATFDPRAINGSVKLLRPTGL